MTEATSRFYEASNLNVETYDARHPPSMAGTPVEGDVAFFVELASSTPGPILELGCGTGRVAIALADAGHHVVGLDRSSAMLNVAAGKREALAADAALRLRFVRGDMSHFSTDEPYGLVIIAFRSFQSLLTVEEQRGCLRSAFDSLRPGGRLAIDLFDPLLDRCVPNPPLHEPIERFVVAHPDRGTTVRVTIEARQNDPVTQRLTERWRFAEINDAGEVVRLDEEELQLRWTYRHEMRHLLELVGFEIEAEYSTFTKDPPQYGRELIFVARR